MMSKCKNCDNAIVQKEGKRQKIFCSDGCRAIYFRKNNKKEPKYVQKETFDKLQAERDMLLATLKNHGSVEYGEIHKLSITTHQTVVGVNVEEIQKQIAAIEKETIPPERNTILGKKVWANDQRKRILELQKQIK